MGVERLRNENVSLRAEVRRGFAQECIVAQLHQATAWNVERRCLTGPASDGPSSLQRGEPDQRIQSDKAAASGMAGSAKKLQACMEETQKLQRQRDEYLFKLRAPAEFEVL